jgi:hypothetical protein
MIERGVKVRKALMVILVGFLSIWMVACSNDSESGEAAADYDVSEEKAESSDFSNSADNDRAEEESDGEFQESDSSDQTAKNVNRKIIYTAKLDIVVKNYQHTLNHIQTQVADYGGYIVESNMSKSEGDETTNGYITVRIPQEEFREFIQLVEEGSSNVLESSISGQDVTEEYVDLESRLKSKRVVEERLLSFMEKAEKTEDLLTISNDLASVQEEIEEIMGRMKYLDNRAELATVTIHIQENNVSLTTMSDKDLNSWDQTKQQFVKSINMLLSFFSSLFIFLVGNLPVLLLLGVIGVLTYWIVQKLRRSRKID